MLHRSSRLRSLLLPRGDQKFSQRQYLGGINEPKQWQPAVATCVQRCEHLVRDVSPNDRSAAVIRALDDISDTVCSVYDSAYFCSIAHAEPGWRLAAQQACATLAGYIQELNMNHGLYSSLVRALQHRDELAISGFRSSADHSPLLRLGFTSEATLVGRMLMRDFERSGVHLDKQQQRHLADLNMRMHTAGAVFGQTLGDLSALGSVKVTDSERVSIPADLDSARQHPDTAGEGLLLTHSLLQWVQQSSADAGLREKVYLAGMRTPKANMAAVGDLIAARHELAQLMGYPSFSHYTAAGYTLAKTPEAIATFLAQLTQSLAPQVQQQMRVLQQCKAEHTRQRQADTQVHAWDRLYYLSMAKRQLVGSNRAAWGLQYSLPAVLQGLQTLLDILFNVRMVKREMQADEAWAEGIMNYAFIHDGEDLGSLYLDLFTRPGKFTNAALFTLKSGRRLADGSYQKAQVALTFNFACRHDSSRQMLSQHEVETLFHEFGHALNSLLSRTEFQHMSGTRGPMDTVEVASHLFQAFAQDARVLQRIGLLQSTGSGMMQQQLQSVLDSTSLFAALDVQQQVVDCKVDQLITGPSPPDMPRLPEAIGKVYAQHSAFPLLQGCLPVLRNTHLVGYGAQYYAYLYAKSLAATTWKQYLHDDPFDKAAGNHIRKELFEVGSAREPEEFVYCLLGKHAIRKECGGWIPNDSIFLENLQQHQGVNSLM